MKAIDIAHLLTSTTCYELGQQMVRKIAIRVTHGLNILSLNGRGDPAALRARKLPLPPPC
jgi:hypothetical protein